MVPKSRKHEIQFNKEIKKIQNVVKATFYMLV